MITPVSMRASYENVTDNQRNIIRDYAKEYAFKRNPNYLSFENDCANFASQALRKAGGRADKNHKIWIDNKYRTWSL
ncbi:Putative amidase domain-containing protein [Peptostreptococcus sp. D1]|nr:Putative amidase domain-containing protein [Peptostreptococcus sp. D1]